MSSVKFGFGYAENVAKYKWSAEDFYPLAVSAEKAGFDYIFLRDHINVFPVESHTPNVWIMKTLLALKTNKVKICTTVTDPHRIHPAALAHMIVELDRLSNGRIILGFGLGQPMNLNTFGIPWNKPVKRLREATEVIRGLYTAHSKKPFDYDGEFFKLKEAFLQSKPIQRPGPPIWFAANAPQTVELTGRIADGWLPGALDPATYAKYLGIIKKSAEKAGRNPEDIEPAAVVQIGISEDAEAAKRAVLQETKFMIVWSGTKYLEEVVKIEVPEDVRDILDRRFGLLTLPVLDKIYNRFKDVMDAVPDEFAEKTSISGSPEDVIERLDRLVKVGCKTFMTNLYGRNHDEAFKLFTKRVMPYFSEALR